MSKPVAAVEVGFMRRTHFEMNKPMKRIAAELDGIIDKLLVLCNSTDSKIALGAAKTLLDYYADAVEMKNKDEITRLLAQSRVATFMPLGGSTVEEKNIPRVDFTTIMDIDLD